ncbi:MAG: efflux RND transporter periplasmic adaptor subunit [Burkholderiales bacterium]|nr:efflux RND transporter periplasmic adaptor subunit [Burkholderiales bacterium]
MQQDSSPDLTRLKLDRSAIPKRSRRRRWLWWGALTVIVVGAGTWFALQPKVLTVFATPVVTTYPSQQFVVLNATGYVVAQRKAAISSKATGRLDWLGVTEGSRVKAGDVIARIDARDVVAQAEGAAANVRATQAALAQALAEETDARAQLKRSLELLTKGFVSAASVDTAKARADRATAAVANARANILVAQANSRNAKVSVDYTVIRAPFDGVILSKSANVGDLVTPFSNATDSKGAVVSMADMSTLEVEADVSESSLSRIRVGQPAEIVLDALPDARFRGRISRMVPTIDRAKATVMTKVRFDEIDPRILPEMSAKVSFLSQDVSPEEQKPLLAVASDALAQRDGRTLIFVIRDGHAVSVPVTPGKKIGDLTAVSGAIRSGEKVVLKPAADLVDGALVKVAAK